MDRRKMMLPDGWYPHSQTAAENRIKSWDPVAEELSRPAVAGIVPHAGWEFSGFLAWQVISSIPIDTELVIVAGGHLSGVSPSRVLEYSSLETPFGNLAVRTDLAAVLCSSFIPDTDADNTVEIQFPLLKYRLPDIQVLPVRLASNRRAGEWGSLVSRYCREQNIKAFFLGSTDLTHYGSRFGYTLYGSGREAKEKIRDLDASYLQLLKEMKDQESLDFALSHDTACSAGAAAAACAFAVERGVEEGSVLMQKYSYEIYTGGDDFVGYGSLLY